jgi:hypothetical protein
VPVKARSARGRDAEGRSVRLAEDAHLLRSPGDIDQRSRAQPDRLERFAIGAHRHFVFGAALEEIPGDARQRRARKLAQVVDVEGGVGVHVRMFEMFSRSSAAASFTLRARLRYSTAPSPFTSSIAP